MSANHRRFLVLLAVVFALTLSVPANAAVPDGDEPLYIYLTRHGQTVTNVTTRMVSNIGSSPLTEAGREVAHYLGMGLSGVPFKAAYCTEKSRTYETAQIVLSESQTSGGLEVQIVPGLHEFNAGINESLTFETTVNEYGFEMSDEGNEQKMLFDQFPTNDTTGLAESWQTVYDRVMPAFYGICEKEGAGGGNILVVAHGGVNRMIGEAISGQMQPGAINSSVVLIKYHKGKYEMLGYNDTSFIEAGKAEAQSPQPLSVRLVAHGTTMMDELGWVNSVIDSPLTANGKAQMEAVGKRLANIEFSAIYSSDHFVDTDSLKALLAQNGKNTSLKANTDMLLRSPSLGLYEGASLEEAKAVTDKMKGATAKARIDAFYAADTTKTAESYKAASTRLLGAFKDVCAKAYEKGGGNIAVVTGPLGVQLIAEAIGNGAIEVKPGDMITIAFDGKKYSIAN